MEWTKCENCSKWAIKVPTGVVLTSYPAQYPQMWKCACGWSQEAGTTMELSNEEVFKRNWNLVQN